MVETKPFDISKRAVWEAYRRVKENRGAAGVDHQSLEDFGENLSNNLYKLWNRLASGSYFPPPVLMVEIPKAHGGMRMLGIPTVTDRIAQMVVKQAFEPCVEPCFHQDSYGYRSRRSGSRLGAGGSIFAPASHWMILREPLIRKRSNQAVLPLIRHPR